MQNGTNVVDLQFWSTVSMSRSNRISEAPCGHVWSIFGFAFAAIFGVFVFVKIAKTAAVVLDTAESVTLKYEATTD